MLKSTPIIFLYLMLVGIFQAYSQHNISKYELDWACFHPIAAIKVKKHLKEAMNVYWVVKASKQLDSCESGGTLDAFRHSFTMAYLSRFVNIKKLRKLGVAHEKGNKLNFYKTQEEFGERPDSLACEMDLRNNELGFFIGTRFKKVSKEELITIMLNEIALGNAWKLKKNDQNLYLSCQNEVILIENYKKSWFLPKCLVKSNE